MLTCVLCTIQLKVPSNRTWPEPDGKGGILIPNGAYDQIHQMYEEERRKEFQDLNRRRREVTRA